MKFTYEELKLIERVAESRVYPYTGGELPPRDPPAPLLEPELLQRIYAALPRHEVSDGHGRPTDGEVQHARSILQRQFYADVKDRASSIVAEVKGLRGEKRREAIEEQIDQECDNAVTYYRDTFDIIHGCSSNEAFGAIDEINDVGGFETNTDVYTLLAYHIFRIALRAELEGMDEDEEDEDEDEEAEDEEAANADEG